MSGGGAVFVGAVHSGPAAVEPPELILDGYDSPILGWLAFALLVTFVTVLAITSLCETGSGGSTEGDAEAAALVAFGRSQSSRQALAPAIGRDPSLPVLVAHAGHRLNRS